VALVPPVPVGRSDPAEAKSKADSDPVGRTELEVLVGRIELKVSEKEVGLRLKEVSGRPGPPVLGIEMPAVEVHVTGVSFGRL
jgi:hypothetical protein